MTPKNEQVIFDSTQQSPPHLRLVHFNDVYHVDASSAEPVGGAARFQTLCNHYRDDAQFSEQPRLITCFSGDAFNPSLESSVTKGSHMVSVLNSIGTDVACVGNHDLDFGVAQFRILTGECKFPWLLANVLDPALGEDTPIGNARRTVSLTASNGIKIGVIGLAEKEWLDTINALPPNLIFIPAATAARELIPKLCAEGAEIIIALTHQREPNDNKLAIDTNGMIDIILGGHDHFYAHSLIDGTHVLRSGTDFKQLSYIEAWKQNDGKWDLKITRRDIDSTIAEDPQAAELVHDLTKSLKTKLEKPVGFTAAPLDARFSTVRQRESNLGNWVCDLMRYYYDTDCCIMASGTIRGDQIYPPGIIKLKDIMDCFPFEDPVVVVKVKGVALLEALENSVSLYPALEGRFPQVSQIQFDFDPEKDRGSRVSNVIVAKKSLDLERIYSLTTRGYMVHGKDGYTSLLLHSEGGTAEEVVSDENGVLISTIIRQYFLSIKVLQQWRGLGPSMRRKWTTISKRLDERHPTVTPRPPGHQAVEAFRRLGSEVSPRKRRRLEESGEESGLDTPAGETTGGVATPMSEDRYASNVDEDHERVLEQERRLDIMRKVTRKWWRISGLKGHPCLCDPLGEGEFSVRWTKAIAPRIEHRIRMRSSSALESDKLNTPAATKRSADDMLVN